MFQLVSTTGDITEGRCTKLKCPREVTRGRQSELGSRRGRTYMRVYAVFLWRTDVLSMSE